MSPHPVVEGFYILEDGRSGLAATLKAAEINTLAFERAEERLGDSIIPTIATARHTHRDAQFCQNLSWLLRSSMLKHAS